MTWAELEEAFSPWTILFAWRDIGHADAARKWFTEALASNDLLVARLEKLITYSYSDTAIPHLRADYIRYFTQEELVRQRLSLRAVGDFADSNRAARLLEIWEYDTFGSKGASSS